MEAPANDLTRDPGRNTFLTAAWRHLVMFNYEVTPPVLREYVPRGTELDSWNGRTFISLVAFRFLDTRVLRVPVPFHRDFEEINLRLYVRREVRGAVRRGVVFIREMVPRRAVAVIAWAFYNEPYRAVPTRSRVVTAPRSVEYSWRLAGMWNSVSAVAAREPGLPEAGSLEEFIAEHYWGYGRLRDGTTLEYRVEHPRWNVAPAASFDVKADLSAVCGAELAGQMERPTSVFMADGSSVMVSTPGRMVR